MVWQPEIEELERRKRLAILVEAARSPLKRNLGSKSKYGVRP